MNKIIETLETYQKDIQFDIESGLSQDEMDKHIHQSCKIIQAVALLKSVGQNNNIPENDSE